MIKRIFSFDRHANWQLPWHWRLPDGSWDIRLTGLLIPAIIWMIIINTNPFLVFLVFLGSFSCTLKAPKRSMF